MKKLILFFLSVGCLYAQSETVDLRSHGKLTLYISDDWKLSTEEYGERTMIKIEPKSESVNASMELTVTYPEQDRLSTKGKLKQEVEMASQPYIEHSVEQKAVAKPINVRVGYGYMCSFTDPELIGKPPQKGNYKTISVGLIHIAPDILAEVSISADGFRSEQYQQLLGAVEGMEHEPGRANRTRGTVGKPTRQPNTVRTMPAKTPTTAGNF